MWFHGLCLLGGFVDAYETRKILLSGDKNQCPTKLARILGWEP